MAEGWRAEEEGEGEEGRREKGGVWKRRGRNKEGKSEGRRGGVGEDGQRRKIRNTERKKAVGAPYLHQGHKCQHPNHHQRYAKERKKF